MVSCSATYKEVGGEEARRVIEEMESQRRAQVKELQAQREMEAERKAAEEEAMAKRAQACEIATQTTPRPQDGHGYGVADQEEAQRCAAELLARREAEQKELETQQFQQLAEAQVNDKKQQGKGICQESDEGEDSESDNEGNDLCIWDVSGNPDRRFLDGTTYLVRFPSDKKTNFVNVLTKVPFRRGVHYFEFVMHHIGDEQWCGITDESFQAGALVRGWNISAWSYYCGRRHVNKPRDQAALHVNRKVVQEFEHVSSGDIIGLLVDAGRQRTAAFLRNGKLQGLCPLPRSRQPLYIFTHLDAAGDSVELRELPLDQAPQSALDAIGVTGARWNQAVML